MLCKWNEQLPERHYFDAMNADYISMNGSEALDALRDHPHHARYSELCRESSPLPWAIESYRAIVVALATGEEQPQVYPSIRQQSANLWRAIRAFVASGGKLAPKAVLAERLAICQGCEFYDRVQKRCTKCGCAGLKVYSAVEKCPLNPAKWKAYEGEAS
jgi:hypothetical protein